MEKWELCIRLSSDASQVMSQSVRITDLWIQESLSEKERYDIKSAFYNGSIIVC